MAQTNLLFHWTGTPYPGFPAWINRDMFSGKYVSTNNTQTAVLRSNTTVGRSGKVTNGFLRALLRAKLISEGCDTDGFGSNAIKGIAEMTMNDTFTGTVIGPGEIACVAYDRATGVFNANKGGTMYAVAKETAAPLFLAMWNYLCEDTLFSTTFNSFCKATDVDTLCSNACLLADIVYEAIKSDTFMVCEASAVNNLTATKMGTPSLKPTLYTGNFQKFQVSKQAGKKTKTTSNGRAMDTSVFVDAYTFRTDVLDADTEQLVPKITDKYIVGDTLLLICKHIKESTSRTRPIRNILLRGEPGTGKTEMYVGIAAGCHLPLYSFAANAMTEPFDLFGQFVPVDENGNRTGAKVPVEEILKGMPSVTDISMDPVLSYQEITGLYKSDASSMDCMSAVFQLAQRNLDNNSSGQQKFKFIPGQLVYAMKNGGVWGFDEVTLPQNPGVVPALNPAMDNTQSITLPTGEIIKRHPSCIFVGTTNVDLEGCRRLNQAWTDRCQLIIDTTEPDDDELVARVKSMTDYDDIKDSALIDLYKFVRAYHEMKAVAKKRRLDDGMIGPRHLADWVLSTMITEDPLVSAKITIVPGATSDERGIAELYEKLSDIFQITNAMVVKFF